MRCRKNRRGTRGGPYVCGLFCVCVCVCVCVDPCLCLCCVHVCVFVYLPVCLDVLVYACVCVPASTCLFLCDSFTLSLTHCAQFLPIQCLHFLPEPSPYPSPHCSVCDEGITCIDNVVGLSPVKMSLVCDSPTASWILEIKNLSTSSSGATPKSAMTFTNTGIGGAGQSSEIRV